MVLLERILTQNHGYSAVAQFISRKLGTEGMESLTIMMRIRSVERNIKEGEPGAVHSSDPEDR